MSPPLRIRALDRAVRFIGVKEHPRGSNHGREIDRWCRRTNGIPGGYPWCAAFIYCMFRDAGAGVGIGGHLPAWVISWVNWGKGNGYVVRRPLRGDVCCFDWNGDRTADHIGIVERVLAVRWRGGRFVGYVRSIEANTAVGNDSNGGEVMRRWRWVNGSQVYIRIPG